MAHTYVDAAAILARHNPYLRRGLLGIWAREGVKPFKDERKLKTRRHPTQKKYRQYSIEDTDLAVSLYVKGEMPATFMEAGIEWVWVHLATLPPYFFGRTSVQEWVEQQCPAFGKGKKLKLRRRWGFQLPGSNKSSQFRDYVKRSDLNRIFQFRQSVPTEDPNWIEWAEAARRTSIRTMRTYAAGGPRRKKPPLKHPKLGRPIKTLVLYVPSNGQAVVVIKVWKPDIDRITDDSGHPLWIREDQTCREYGFTARQLWHLATEGKIDRKKFPIPIAASGKDKVFHYYVPHLKATAESKANFPLKETNTKILTAIAAAHTDVKATRTDLKGVVLAVGELPAKIVVNKPAQKKQRSDNPPHRRRERDHDADCALVNRFKKWEKETEVSYPDAAYWCREVEPMDYEEYRKALKTWTRRQKNQIATVAK